jgi:transcriptional regulator with XRE-family HTH domain
MSLRIARKIAGLSQKELAERAGVDNTGLCRMERGERQLRLADYDTVVRVAAALNLEPDELLTFAAIPDPERHGRRTRDDDDAETAPPKPRRTSKPARLKTPSRSALADRS